MKAKGRTLQVVMLAGLLLVSGRAVAQEAAPAAEMPKVSAAQLLEVVPADAWLVVGLHDVEALDLKFMQLVRAFSAPAGFLPTGGVRYLAGGGDPIDMAGTHGLIVLSPKRFPDARTWWWLEMIDLPAVAALQSSDPAALLKSLNPEPAEGGISKLMLGEEESYGAIRGKYLLISADAKVLAALLEGIADPKATKAADPVLSEACAGADVLLDVNIRAMLTEYRDDWQLSAAACLDEMVADESARAPRDAIDSLYRAAMASVYVNLLLEQVGDMLIAGNVAEERVLLSGRVTYPAGSALRGVRAANEADRLLLGLPAKDFMYVLSAGEPFMQTLTQLAGMLRPLFGMMAFADDYGAREFARTMGGAADHVAPRALQTRWSYGIYTRPGSDEGIVSLVLLLQRPEMDKFWTALQPGIVHYLRAMGLRAGDGSEVAESDFRYLVGAEKVGLASVDHWVVDTARMQEGEDEDHVKAENAGIALFLGKDGTMARIVRTDTRFVGVLGGDGRERIGEAIAALAAGEAPLAADPRVAQARQALPGDRILEGYVAPDMFASFFTTMTRELSRITQQGPTPNEWTAPERPTPFAAGLANRPEAARFDIYLSMDGMVVMKDFFVWMYEYQQAQFRYYMEKYQESQEADEEGEMDEDQAEETEGTDEPAEEPDEAAPLPM